MKHSLGETLIVLLYAGWAIALGVLLVPRMARTMSIVTELTDWQLGLCVLGILVVSSLTWFFLIDKAVKHVDAVFASAIGIAIGNTLRSSFDVSLWLVLLVAVLLAWSVYFGSQWMRHSWRVTMWLQPLMNILMLGAAVIGASQLAVLLSPWVAGALLLVGAVYDAIAVWKIQSMQKMALAFWDLRLFPGIALPKKEEGQFAGLGGGDIFFMVLITGSLMLHAPSLAYPVLIGMSLALIGLFLGSQQGKFYPALPFILGGALLGVIGGII